MTGQDILDKFGNLADQQDWDTDFAVEVMNDAMHEIEEEVKPEGLKKIDTTQSTFIGQTYTNSIPLPSDFFLPNGFIYVGTDRYKQIRLERAVDYQDISGFFFVDTANAVYYLTGTIQTASVISFPYFYSTPDITLTTAPVWPERFHSLIPLKMAQMYFATDAGDKNRAWDDRWQAYYESRLARFKDYDATLKLAALNSETPYGYEELPPYSENKINDLF